MRHKKTGVKLSRTGSHRRALYRNLSIALITHEQITTTLPKAKALRSYVEPLITRAKLDSVANRRHAFARLRHDSTVAKLFTELGPRYSSRPGGYLRIFKCGHRVGDSAPMGIVVLVDGAKDILSGS